MESMCEHHFMPFYGRAHIVYIPKNGGYNRVEQISETGGYGLLKTTVTREISLLFVTEMYTKKHRFTQFLHTLNEKMRKPIKSYVFCQHF